MTDAFQWLINLMLGDVSRLVAGILLLVSVLEVLIWFKEKIKP